MPADPSPTKGWKGTVAFAVHAFEREGKTLYQPVQLWLAEDGSLIKASALQEAVPYEALAYEYLEGGVNRHYLNLQSGRAQAQAAAQPKRRGRPPKYGPGAEP